MSLISCKYNAITTDTAVLYFIPHGVIRDLSMGRYFFSWSIKKVCREKKCTKQTFQKGGSQCLEGMSLEVINVLFGCALVSPTCDGHSMDPYSPRNPTVPLCAPQRARLASIQPGSCSKLHRLLREASAIPDDWPLRLVHFFFFLFLLCHSFY